MADQINTDNDGGGNYTGIVLVVAIVILVALGAYFLLNSGPLVAESEEVNVDIEAPAAPEIDLPEVEMPELPEAPEPAE